MGPIVNTSTGPQDGLTGAGTCGTASASLPVYAGAAKIPHALGRCGYGPRLPLLVVSPWAKANFVDHSVTDQTSVLRFVEDLFLNAQRLGAGSFDAQAGSLNNMFDFSKSKPKNEKRLILNPDTGLVQQGS